MDDTLTFKLPSKLKLDFNIIALKNGKSMGELIRQYIEKYIDENKN